MASITTVPPITLGPLDQIAPRIYVRSVFVFDVDSSFDINKALCHVAIRLQLSLMRWPFLAGQIRPAANPTQLNQLELSYDLDENRSDPLQRPDLFAYEFCRGLWGFNYEELKELDMPPSAMDKDILSLSPDHPKPGESCPPITLKVTRVDRGGLILCFSTHHAIFDGGFINTFLEFFGNGWMVVPGIFLGELAKRPSMEQYKGTNIKGAVFPEYNFTKETDLVAGMDRLTVAQVAEAPEAVCLLFKIQNLTLRTLHERALTKLRLQYGPDAFVSVVDTLSALVWVHTTRARLEHLALDDKTSFTTAADARPRLSPAFSADSWGNVYTQTSASTTVADLIQYQDTMDADSTPAIIAAAWLIRQAVNQVSAPGYIPSRIALAASLVDPTAEGVAFRRALRPDHAGLGCSVWTHMGADVDFRIPGTAGKADYVRKTWSANEGSMNIMQRRGITKGDAPWEVLLALREDDMKRMCAPTELGRWAVSWCG
ncbi:hypothetical protein QIS74_09704 [Colletotrichum tabaci]|uniref:Trichothecene 3-O-acetyltransferase n=1 Tax=Colletotrichum tabaci TaxID=1209068 RepID=A0AAV9T5B5_9PEZI